MDFLFNAPSGCQINNPIETTYGVPGGVLKGKCLDVLFNGDCLDVGGLCISNNDKECNIFLPSSLNLKSVIARNTGKAGYPSFLKSRKWRRKLIGAAKFLTLLRRVELNHYEAPGGFVPLSSTLIRKECGAEYAKVIDILERGKVIDVFRSKDGVESYSNYSGDRFCKKYRIHRRFSEKDWYPVDDDLNIIGEDKLAICRVMARIPGIVKVRAATEAYLYECLSKVSISAEADEYLSAFKFRSKASYHQVYLNLYKMRAGNWFFTRHSDGRIYHNVTNLPARSAHGNACLNLRQFLRYEGQPLIALDISASQPYFAHTFYSEAKTWDTSAVVTEKIKYLGLFHVPTDSFYLNFGKECLKGDYTKAMIKDILLPQVFFAKLWSGKGWRGHHEAPWGELGGRIVEAFQREFPILFSIICEIKREDYALCANRLTAIEAEFMFESICPDLIEKSGGSIPLITIHDCILTTAPFVDLVQARMNALFENRYGLGPRIHKKRLDDNA